MNVHLLLSNVRCVKLMMVMLLIMGNYFGFFLTIFYVCGIRLTWHRLRVSFFINASIGLVANLLPHYDWLFPIITIVASIRYFWRLTKDIWVIFHVVVISLCIMITQYAVMVLAFHYELSIVWHVMFILFLMSPFLLLYRYFIAHFMHVHVSAKAVTIFIITVIVALCFFYTIFFLLEDTSYIRATSQQLVIVVLSFTIFLMVSIGSLYVVLTRQQMVYERVIYEQFAQYIQHVEQVNSKLESLQHDYHNIFLTMQQYMIKGDLKSLTQFYQQHIATLEQEMWRQQHTIQQISHVKIPAIKGLLAMKLQQEANITIEISEEITNFYMDVIDVARIFGIFIDNALQANSEEGNIHISFLLLPNEMICTFKNNAEEMINIPEIFHKGITTKENGKGLGLANVQQILTKYPHVQLLTYMERQQFVQQLMIRREEA